MTSPPTPAADVRRVLDRAASVMATASASSVLGDSVERIFTLPAGAEEYRPNRLMPDSVPCEISFSENELNTLRFAFELVQPEQSLAWCRARMTEEAVRIVERAFGPEQARRLDAQVSAWLRNGELAPKRFSAWMAPVIGASGLQALKLYYDVYDDQLATIPEGLRAVLAKVRAVLPDSVPWYFTFRTSGRTIDHRLTMRQRTDIPLLQFGDAAVALGLGREFDGLARFLRLIADANGVLSNRRFLFGLGDSHGRPELKVEFVLTQEPGVDHDEFQTELMRLLRNRPQVIDGLRTWREAFEIEGRFGEDLTLLSVRIAPKSEPLVNIYLRHPTFRL